MQFLPDAQCSELGFCAFDSGKPGHSHQSLGGRADRPRTRPQPNEAAARAARWHSEHERATTALRAVSLIVVEFVENLGDLGGQRP